MLNELLIVDRGARQAGLEMSPRHPDVKDARLMPTLLVLLNERGHVASVRPVHRDLIPWTLRDGQHNSFPFVQPKPVLLDIPPDQGFELRLISALTDHRDSTEGKNLIIVADINNVLSFRILESDGRVVVDADETELAEHAGQVADLKKQLGALRPPHEPTTDEKTHIITIIRSITGYDRRQTANNRKSSSRRAALLALAGAAPANVGAFDEWPGAGFLNRLRERRLQVEALVRGEATALPAAIDRFLLACDSNGKGPPTELLWEVVRLLHTELEKTADSHWLEVAAALLIGKQAANGEGFASEGALLFDAEGASRSVSDKTLIAPVSDALRAAESETGSARFGCCGLSGEAGPLVESKFPQPNLPVLGQTFIFARNRDTPANGRYDRSSADSMPVGKETAIRLAAAAEALTSEERRGKTWRPIPGETPKQTDLLLVFADAAPDAPTADALAEDEIEEDWSAEARDMTSEHANSVAIFEKRTERVVDAVQAKLDADFTGVPVLRLAVVRKVDPANRKIVCSGEVPVHEYHRAAKEWAAGERNVPSWLRLPILYKGDRKPRLTSPPHIAPLGVIAFSRQLFLRGGTEQHEIIGVPASEALGLFLGDDPHRARRLLRLVLSRRIALVTGSAHAWRRGIGVAKEFNGREVLRTATLLGVLLFKLDRRVVDSAGGYMDDIAFKLGQLLAATDVVHAGYCADVRGGDLPPSLLGNQVFAMAQTAPVKALATLCRRWRPYDGWATKMARESSRIEALPEQRRWDVRKALRHAREMRALASHIAPILAEAQVNDVFRAELLLGYLAGLPKPNEDVGSDDKIATTVLAGRSQT